MPRRIEVQVDAYGVDRQEIHNRIFDAVSKSCGIVIESGYETGRSFFGMWTVWFVIPSESHTDENYKNFQKILKEIYEDPFSGIRGFQTIWEGDRHQKMVNEAISSVKRFGKVSFNLGPEYFKHLQDKDAEDNIDA